MNELRCDSASANRSGRDLVDQRINLLIEKAGRVNPIYLHRVILLTAEYYSDELGWRHEVIQAMLRTASHVQPLVGLHLVHEWYRLRQTSPVWRRALGIGKEMTTEWEQYYTELQRLRADEDFKAALRLRGGGQRCVTS